ncbi:lanthionine synthetase LanC family protein [Bailinhaonella thermotolerans]|uniref:non-specific serine/threonine protein kinase n=1 Tax=Bailinhaonella thermotolerans TaxID=1070861 RepID=A0A3A4BB15_9ACTN|nr:lanthionine synthetase LanC family protein [Bailinhaonella thermotolerans]RJL35276.1 serine/threonine protein kinase [Bailinhaonella thermotolerans]
MTDAHDAQGQIERTVRKLAEGRPHVIRTNSLWLMVDVPAFDLPEHGWKFHISSRAPEFAEFAELIVPVLLDLGCPFKLARTRVLLEALNDGLRTPAAVGKACTVYPPQDRVREIGLRLADLLRGRKAPRVLSDRRVSDDAPVYYRYGPFVGSWNADARGQVATRLRGPGGQTFDGEATLTYRQPPWATDPFTGENAESVEHAVLGGRYRLVEGVHESARGNIFRAVDERDGSIVIVKQARAFVLEDDHGLDTRFRLRNERRVLSRLGDLEGVPRFLDHFRHGEDEFLVITDVGRRNLEEDLLENGRYLTSAEAAAAGLPARGRTLEELGRSLAVILLDLHRRGIVMYDLSPKNIVVDGDRPYIIDFGFASGDGIHMKGGTFGYMPARQRAGLEPLDHDDLHGLGMTLWYAASFQQPVESDDDHDLPRRRALQQIRRAHGPAPGGVMGAIADLLSGDAGRARAAAGALARGQAHRHPATAPLAALPPVDEDLVAALTAGVLGDLVAQTTSVIEGRTDSPAEHDASLYSGSAGAALELLRHRDDAAVAGLLPALLEHARATAERTALPHGLYAGRTGVDLALHVAGLRAEPRIPGPGWEPEGPDVVIGAAGVGLGHLYFHARGLGEEHLRVAGRCLELIQAGGLRSPYSSERYPDTAGFDTAAGYAHGLAGVVGFLLDYTVRTGDADAARFTEAKVRELIGRTEPLLARAAAPAATPLAASWCQGQTGAGQVLHRAGRVLGDARCAELAARCAQVCLDWVPRLVVVGPCCGAVGVGHLLLDLALDTGDQRYLDGAREVVTHLLLRSGGTPDHPDFVNGLPGEGGTSWAQGLTGVLTFLRRLRDAAGPALLPPIP